MALAWHLSHLPVPPPQTLRDAEPQCAYIPPARHDAPPTEGKDEEDADDPAALRPGEDEAAWQERLGFACLTPGAVRLFDASRKFKRDRDASRSPPAPSDYEQSLASTPPHQAPKRHTLSHQPNVDDADDAARNANVPGPARAWGQGLGTRARKRARKEAKLAELAQQQTQAQPRMSPGAMAVSRALENDLLAPVSSGSTSAVGDLESAVGDLESLRARALASLRSR